MSLVRRFSNPDLMIPEDDDDDDSSCHIEEDDRQLDSDKNLISDKELSECDREKLHLLGHIQDGAGHVLFFSHPEGVILAADLKVRQVSWIRNPDLSKTKQDLSSYDDTTNSCRDGNMPSVSGSKRDCHGNSKEPQQKGGAQDIIGSKMESCVPASLWRDIKEALNCMRNANSQRTFRFFTYNDESFAISISSVQENFGIVAVEIEEMEANETSGDFYNTLVSLGRVMEFYADEKLIGTACDTVFNLLGSYDRGMVYQFQDDLSGEVVHEVKKDYLTSSYMGMRFPASDIPLPARQLYIKNGLRYIQNVHSDNNPILDNGNIEVDLSHCRMRAVAKPHIVYLRNMGVVSSLSIAIVVEDKLWGLLAFHGYRKSFKPSLHQRIACESIMSMVSVKVEALMRKAQSARIIELSEILMKWEQSHSVAHNLQHHSKDVLKVFDADVLVSRIVDPLKDEPDVVVLGDSSLVPKEHGFWKKLEHVPHHELLRVNTREEVSKLLLTESESPASGFVYFQDSLVKVMIGRGLRSKDVVWAGNPDEPKLRIGGILCPRNSFKTFMQKARKESRAWSATDVHVISTFRDRVCEHSHNRTATLLKNDIEGANVKYMDALARTEDNCQFFAQMSHELRTPFHGVMGCLNIMHDSIQEMSESEIKDLINTAMSTGNHMITLLNDILNISKDRHQMKAPTIDQVKLSELVSEPVENLRSLAANKKITLRHKVEEEYAEATVITDKQKFIQIISNILNNGIKFSEGGCIDIAFTICDSMAQAVNKWGEEASTYAGTVFTMDENGMYDSVGTVKSKVGKLCETKKSDKKWVLASVADSGCGMKPGELAEMMKPYTQSSKGSNRTFQGTGLGLFICVSLSYQLNGFVACSSTPGTGSVFHVGIPVGVPEAAHMANIPDSIPTHIVRASPEDNG